MFIVSLNYIKPLNEVDALIQPHIDWLNRYFAEGLFISAGRKQPRTGGVILVKTMSREQLEHILQQDPFQQVADYQITEVTFSKTGPEFEQLLNC
ncbi:YciI family protein [Acinetobacter ursingii]|uniref:YciI family protein n=1 Tax=Acinetobacter ursingii TaxID=108980 RepID=UPI0021CDAEEA|nr:YciI family protein [Acinetobacter ursingii]MCU4483207.1 hypothetical protein [Acinetobacter ursingii]MCU4507527.1 hypothetical protein [Acinetobacter ursingii]MCU4571348.1 hypothetical protein [Acinetobacter ursingii]